jgi:hypothetical protein
MQCKRSSGFASSGLLIYKYNQVIYLRERERERDTKDVSTSPTTPMTRKVKIAGILLQTSTYLYILKKK